MWCLRSCLTLTSWKLQLTLHPLTTDIPIDGMQVTPCTDWWRLMEGKNVGSSASELSFWVITVHKQFSMNKRFLLIPDHTFSIEQTVIAPLVGQLVGQTHCCNDASYLAIYSAGRTGPPDPATAGPIFSTFLTKLRKSLPFTRMILMCQSSPHNYLESASLSQKPQSMKSSSVCRASLPVSVSSLNRCVE